MAKRRNPEYILCVQFVSMLNYTHSYHAKGLLVYHNPNGQRAGSSAISRKIHGALDKNMGAVAGVYDYTAIWVDRNGVPKMGFLEAKASTGTLSSKQREFRDHLNAIGINNGVFKAPDDGMKMLQEWGAISRDCTIFW